MSRFIFQIRRFSKYSNKQYACLLDLQIKENVAGATFMAAGSSAPELFTSLIGIYCLFLTLSLCIHEYSARQTRCVNVD